MEWLFLVHTSLSMVGDGGGFGGVGRALEGHWDGVGRWRGALEGLGKALAGG